MSTSDFLRQFIFENLKSLSFNVPLEKIILDHPKDINHGDYSTNIALLISKEQKKDPKELASLIANSMKNLPPEIEKISVAGVGFINIHLSKSFFIDQIKEIKKTENYGSGKSLENKKIIVEYTNTNVLKPLHIGHLMGNVIGESLSRIFTYCGAEVKRATYQGDVGLHIAKTLWGIQGMSVEYDKVLNSNIHEQITFIGQAYSKGANAYEEDKIVQEKIKEINKKMFERSDKDLNSLYGWARQVSLDHFEEIYKKLVTKFDYYFFESEVEKEAAVLAKKFLEASIFESSDGAVVFKAEKHDPSLHTRVFLNSQGIPTYEAKDIAHAVRKNEIYKADQSIIITANEQNGYFKVVLTALKQLFPEIAEKTTHLSHGMLKLTTGKMSSRKGNVITGESLISDMEEAVTQKMSDREFDISVKNKIATEVGIGAIKYSILRQGLGRDIIFDPEKSLSFDGDSGPYIQYAHTRASSILRKAKEFGLSSSIELTPENVSILEKMLYRFPEIVMRSATEKAPNHIVTYLVELAGEFNSYYAQNTIVDDKDVYSPYRIALTEAVERILSNGLYVLGIAVPEQM